jgi:hypothetical protein
MATPKETQHRKVKVKGAVVRKLRKARHLSIPKTIERLDEEGAGMSEATLKRIESRKSDSYAISRKVADALAKLLGTTVGVLAGEEHSSDEKANRDFLPEFSLPLPRRFHNALAVVCFAYGISPATVIANAPLLFAIAAQRSLDARSRSLEAARQAVNAVESHKSHLGFLHVTSLNADSEASEVAGVFDDEASSIAARDILGEGVKDLRLHDDEDAVSASPFLDFLREEAREAGLKTAACTYPEATLVPVPDEDGQDLVASAIDAMAGSDAELKEAIAQADFIVPDRAWKALRSASPEQRTAALRRWMERDEYGARQREWRKLISEDLSALLKTKQDGDE